MRKWLGSVLTLFAIMVASVGLKAASITIDDTTELNILLTCSDFEGGLFLGNVSLGCDLGTTVTEEVSEAVPLNFEGYWVAPVNPFEDFFAVIFTEGPDSNIVSDVLEVSLSGDGESGHIIASFVSDGDGPDGSLGTFDPADLPDFVSVWDENQGAFTFTAPYLTASVISDPVPEPSTMLLLAIGLVGVGSRKYGSRKNRKA